MRRMKRFLSVSALLGLLLLAAPSAWAQAGFISGNNSSVTALAGSGVFTGVSEDVSGYQAITVTVFANQVSAAGGLSLQYSPDNVNWDTSHTYTVAASVPRTVVESVYARYFRVVYTNGATAQTAFRLQTIYDAAPTSNDRATSQQLLIQPSQVSATANGTTTRATLTGLDAYTDLDILINFTAGGAATGGTVQLFIEDSADGGTTWDDLASSNTFTIGAAAATQHFFIAGKIATGATQGAAAAIETLAAGTVRAGPWGNQIRVREKIASANAITVGATYTITAVVKR
ncbi:MAG TPA: DUF6385 domain-containing protein [Vicinamibacterales bacterium]|nr:DUF6385 domain-containing protein [Vicinamibacterales bacterium]